MAAQPIRMEGTLEIKLKQGGNKVRNFGCRKGHTLFYLNVADGFKIKMATVSPIPSTVLRPKYCIKLAAIRYNTAILLCTLSF